MYRIIKITFVLFLISIALGSFSIRPFTKILKPYIIFNQWIKANRNSKINVSCIQYFIENKISFTNSFTPKKDIEKGCFINTPILISHLPIKLTNIAYPSQADYVVLNCEFAKKLHLFIKETLMPLVSEYYKQEVKIFLHKGAYACRGLSTFSTIKSEHAFSEAIDFAGIQLADGRQILVEKNYFDKNINGEFLRSLEKAACNYFGTNLGPNFNEKHHDHFHWSIGFPRACK